VRFGADRVIYWYGNNKTPKKPDEPRVKVQFDDTELDGNAVQSAVKSITGAYDRFPKDSLLVLGRENASHKSIFAVYGAPSVPERLIFETPPHNIPDEMSAVRHILGQVGRQLDRLA
jgi:hypothetical protein